jgi:hypothetical protein
MASSTASHRVCVQLSHTGRYASICRVYLAGYWLVPAAETALWTLFRLLDASFARVLQYIDTRQPICLANSVFAATATLPGRWRIWSWM